MYSSFRLQTNDSTTLHLAAAGGHREVVKVLLEAGASATDENAVSVTEQNLLLRLVPFLKSCSVVSTYSLSDVTTQVSQ